MKTYSELLRKYLPEQAISIIVDWLKSSNVQLKITKSRSTKLGDYRPPIKNNFHRISVNHDLNKYHFLITLVHEFAHLKTWDKYKSRVKPHGKEWKDEFKNLMQPFLSRNIFPADLQIILINYLKNPASTTSDTALQKKLREFDSDQNYFTLEELPFNAKFSIYNGYVFRKMLKVKKRYKCQRLDNNKIYLVSPLMKVVPLDPSPPLPE